MIKFFKIIFFSISLLPISIDGFGVNYGFVLFSAASILYARKIYLPHGLVAFGCITYLSIFALSLPFAMIISGDYLFRATISFVIFVSAFCFSLIRIELTDINSFRYSLILTSCILAGDSVLTYIVDGSGVEGEDLKNLVGSQRTGFIYVISLFVLIYRSPHTRILRVARMCAVSLILIGVIMTHSRASIVALAATLFLYYSYNISRRRKIYSSDIRNAASTILIGSGLLSLLHAVFPEIFGFYSERLLVRFSGFIEPVLPSNMISSLAVTLPDEVLIEEGSEGTRLAIWGAILKYVTENPILGSGYLGSWILEGVTTGSAHNQYMDVLLRTGFIGFGVWIIILVKVFHFLLHRHPDLFWGGCGILIYGMFHETFKETQGNFILAFLIGIYVNHVREARREKPNSPAPSNFYRSAISR